MVEQYRDVTLAPWVSEIEFDELNIMQVQYLSGELYTGRNLGDDKYEMHQRPAINELTCELRIMLFSYDKESVYSVEFFNVNAFRVLDEHGLLDFPDTDGKSTFRAGGHGWTRESELSFSMVDQNMSWIIMTEFDCVEVVSTNEPEIKFIEKLEPRVYEGDLTPNIVEIINPRTKH